MPRYAFSFEYDGTRFGGSVVQPDQRTVQAVVEEALSLLDHRPVRVILQGRLDTGVHAEALTAHADLERAWHPFALGRALNGNLPDDLHAVRVAEVAPRFHAQHAAVSKTYRYQVLHRAAAPALDPHVWWQARLRQPHLLDECAALLTGDLDLSAFSCLRHDGTDHDDPVRRYFDSQWQHLPWRRGVLHVWRITGSGFLYRQVRALAGAMVAVANGALTFDDFQAAVAAGRAHPRPGQIAPAQGLTLERVTYDPEPEWWDLGPDFVELGHA